VLNAIMGVGRSLYQAAEDGQLPRWFQKKNRHGVPSNAMAFNVVCAAILVLLGSPLRIYIISNGGYLLSCAGALGGYFVYRHLRPNEHRPFRLPTWCKWLALAVFIFWMVIYFFGGWNSPKVVVGPGQGPGLYLLGLLIVALYAPLYLWRAWQDRRLAAAGRLKLAGAGATEAPPPAQPSPSPLANGGAPDAVAPDAVSGAEPSGEPPVVR
jgi:amino acid transporter